MLLLAIQRKVLSTKKEQNFNRGSALIGLSGTGPWTITTELDLSQTNLCMSSSLGRINVCLLRALRWCYTRRLAMTIFSVTQRFAGSQIKELKQTLFRVVQNSFASIKSKQINTQSPASGLRLHAGLYTAISRKVVEKSARDKPERYCGWFWIHCSSKKVERMVFEAMDICLRVLKEIERSLYRKYLFLRPNEGVYKLPEQLDTRFY